MFEGTCVSNCKPNTVALVFPVAWKKFRIGFDQLSGGSSPFTPTDIRSINFVSGGTAEFWIDDVAFY